MASSQYTQPGLQMPEVTAVILAYNEQRHLARCLDSLASVASKVVVVDCHSTDSTVEIAQDRGARVIRNTWVNYSSQFNWALSQLPENTEWVLRIDADEVMTPALAAEIAQKLPGLDADINGVYCGRRMAFQGRLIRHGGLFPIRVVRLFRFGYGECEHRWMDEHIKVKGATVNFQGELVDNNLNSLSWWTDKHNRYASLEAIEMLNLTYGFMSHDEGFASLGGRGEPGFKRWLKERIYARLPGGFRAFVYFLFRYVVCLGFLDGKQGTAFHVLQGFWYRFLVDAKVAEVKRYMREQNADVKSAIDAVLGIQL